MDQGFVRSASVGGNDTDLMPPVLAQWSQGDPAGGSARPGSNYYATTGAAVAVKSWDGGKDFGQVYNGLEVGSFRWAGDTFVWDATLTAFSEIWTWTAADGARALVSYGPDFTQAVANVATDGVDLVWVYGKGRDPKKATDPYPIADLMTAPFTSDPAELVPKRVRSFPVGHIWGGIYRNVVGCGHAAYRYTPPGGEQHLLIVRLSDGVSWTLAGPADEHWRWGPPIAVTCDEVFAVWGKGLDSLRRIRLSSLGPGDPPD